MQVPLDAGAVLLIELRCRDSHKRRSRFEGVCLEQHAREVRRADDNERACSEGRKGAFGVGARGPSFYTQDGGAANKIPAVLQFIDGVSKKYGLRIGNIFHAGDGNLHPLILFDARDPNQLRMVEEAGREILQYCIDAGGSITGEHGVGVEKRDLMPQLFSNDDLDVMLSLRNAFNFKSLLNPGKIFPTSRTCVETRGPVQSHPGAGGHVADGDLGRPCA